MLIRSLLQYLMGLEKDFLEMLLYYNLLFKIAFDIRNVVYDHKNKPKYDV